MNRTWLLLKTQLYNYFSINEIMEPNSQKKNASFIAGIGVLTIGLFLCAYNVLTAISLVEMGQQNLIPAYMVAVSSFAILLLSMFNSNGILFGSRDFEMLSALPIKSSEIISSKFWFMYLLNFVLGFVFMVPGGIVWAIHSNLNVLFLLLYIITIFFVPLIPMCIAALIGVGIAVLSSRFSNKNIFSLLFSFMMLGVIGYVVFSSTQSGTANGNIGAMLADQISGMYPFSRWFLIKGNYPFTGATLFLLISATIFFLFIKIVAGKYNQMNSILMQAARKSVKRKENLKHHSRFMALYQKEFGRFFSSYMYVLNTSLGVVLLCISSIIFAVVSPDTLARHIGVENVDVFFGQFAPIIIASMLSLSCPAASSISLEGKNIWILQSAPLSMKTFLKSKIAVNLTLHSFGYWLAVMSFSFKLKLDGFQLITLFAIPAVYSIFTAVQGSYFNSRFPNFEWENETLLVKQSIPVILSSAVGMVAVAIPVLIHWFLDFSLLLTLWGMALILSVTTYLLYSKACKIKII